MQLGLSSLYLIAKSFEQLLHSIELHDVPLWEIVDEDSLKLNKQRIQTLKQLKKKKDLELTVHAPFADANIASLVPEMRRISMKRLQESLIHASELEAVAWVMHPGQRGPLTTFYPEKEWRLNVEAIVEMTDMGEELGVNVCIENMPRGLPLLMDDPESFEKIGEESGKNRFKMVLDIGHANTSCGAMEFLDRLKNEVVHIHAHDNNGKVDSHDEIGKGTVNWRVLAKRIRECSCQTVVVESTKGVDASLERLRGLLASPTGQ